MVRTGASQRRELACMWVRWFLLIRAKFYESRLLRQLRLVNESDCVSRVHIHVDAIVMRYIIFVITLVI